MAEYIDNGVDVVSINERISFKDSQSNGTPCRCVDIGQDGGFIFNKSGLYYVSISGNYTTVTNVAPQKHPCDWCKHDPRRKSMIEKSVFYIPEQCVCCSRRCTDHYEKES